MEQGINQSLLFHVRIVSVIVILLLLDSLMLAWSLDYTLKFGVSMVIVLGFEVINNKYNCQFINN